MNSLPESADVTIIGGGIVGASLAYYLARGGAHALLLEKDLMAQASTGLCVGGVRQQFFNPSNILLSQKTVRLFERFAEEFGEDNQFHQVGYLFLAREKASWESFRKGIRVQHALKVPVQILTPDEIHDRWPYLFVDDILGGTFCEEDGYADPHITTMAFARAARKGGTRIVEQTRVTAIRRKDNRIIGVNTDRGPINTPKVINAAGAWAAEIGRMTQTDIPVLPYRRQVFMTKAVPQLPKPVPMIIDMDAHFYFRGEGEGILTGMSDRNEPPGFKTHTDRAFMEKVIEQAVRRAPVLEKAEILRGWAGLYAITPDENPVIGPVPGIAGLYCAAGFSGHGFQHGPSVGKILAELVLTGNTDFDLSPFSLERFSHKKHTIEGATV